MSIRTISGGLFLQAAIASILLLWSCMTIDAPPRGVEKSFAPQRDPIIISLSAPWGDAKREYSGAAIYDGSVVLMPQYPGRTDNSIPMFSLKRLLAPNANEGVQVPRVVPFNDDGLANTIKGFEGFEALAFRGNDVFVTIESHQSTGMMGYLVRGKMIFSDSAPSIKLDATSLIELPPRANLANATDEAIVILPDGRLLTLFEANGANVARNPFAYMFDISGDQIRRLANVSIPNVEYRITDCSSADINGEFWCINCMYPGDEAELKPARDSFGERWGVDRSQLDAWKAGNKLVERLVKFRFDGVQIRAAENSPIYLNIHKDAPMRNWESLAFVAGQGFFIATDEYPTTLFAFVHQ
jgi:hypothetical protein